MAYFTKNFNAATFENARKYHMSFSQLCEKYGLSDTELEQAIRNVYHKRKAEEMLKAFREQDEKQRKPKSKKTRSHDSEPAMAPEATVAPKLEIVHEAVIEVEEITPDNVDEVVSAVDALMAEPHKSTLELLQEKEKSLSESLSVAKSELDKLCGIKAEISQKLLNLTNEVRELKNTIEQKISEVGELRDYSAEVKNQITVAELDVAALKKELVETQEAIKVEQLVTITVLADGWFKFEPAAVDIPKVEVSAEELSTAAAKFASDSQFENLTLKNIRQLLLLDKMVQELGSAHSNIVTQFEEDHLGIAWMTWKQE